MQAEKLQLMKMLLETEDKSILNQIKAFFETRPNADNWFNELPVEIQASVNRGLDQSSRGIGRPHAEVKRKYEKWLSK